MLLARKVIVEVKKDKALLVVLLMVIAYTTFFTTYSLLKHYTFKTYAHDLGVYYQALCTLFKGYLFYETPDLIHNPSGSFFGVHFSPILFLIAPIFAIYPSVEVLFFIQSLVLGFAAIPVYLLSRHHKLPQELSVILALSYLLHPFTQSANLYDFHPHSFIPLYILFMFYFIERREYVKATVFLILASFTIEVATVISMFSILGIIIRKVLQDRHLDKKLIGLLALPMIILIVGIVVMDFFAPSPLKSFSIPFLMKAEGSTSPSDVINYILTNKIFTSVTYDLTLKIIYWTIAFSFVFFMPLLNLLDFFSGIPWLIYTITTMYRNLYILGFHYGAIVLGSLYYATVRGVARLKENKKLYFILKKISKKKKLASIIPVSILVLLSLLDPISPITHSIVNIPLGSAYVKPDLTLKRDALYEAMTQISEAHTLFTQTDVFPHICCRKDVYVWLPNDIFPEWILLDFKLEGVKIPVWNITPVKKVQELLLKANYKIVFMKDGVVLWVIEKDSIVTHKAVFEEDHYVIDFTKLALVNAEININKSKPTLESKAGVATGQVLWFGPYIALPPGRYVVRLMNMTLIGCLKLNFLASLPKREDRLLQSSLVCGNGTIGNYYLDLTLPTPVEDFEIVGIALMDFRYCALDNIIMDLKSPP